MAKLIAGHRNFGKVDQIGDFCYVATQFFHIYFLPLFPVQTFVVLISSESSESLNATKAVQQAGYTVDVPESIDDRFIGVPVGYSIKSIFLAWLRAALYIALPTVFVLGLLLSSKSSTLFAQALALWFDLVGLISIILLTYRVSYIELLWPYPFCWSLPGPRLVLYFALPIVFVLVIMRTVKAIADKPDSISIDAFFYWLALVGMLATLVLTYFLSRPSLKRAIWMADQLGASRLKMAKLLYPQREEDELAMQLEYLNEWEVDSKH